MAGRVRHSAPLDAGAWRCSRFSRERPTGLLPGASGWPGLQRSENQAGEGLGDSPRSTLYPGVAFMSPASALRSPGPEDERASVGTGWVVPWDGLTFPHTCLRPLPVSRPVPDLCPLWHLRVSGALQASGCVGPGRPRQGTWVSAASARLSVINPASASSLDCVDTADPRSAQPRRPALVGSCPCAPFPATGSEARPAGPRVAGPASLSPP